MPSTPVSRVDLPMLNTAAAVDKQKSLGERLDLVDQVSVKLTVSLGEAQMTVGRLFSLAANDVVALDRAADAPVDLRLHDKTIARGTLVAVGDKFGLRITEILART